MLSLVTACLLVSGHEDDDTLNDFTENSLHQYSPQKHDVRNKQEEFEKLPSPLSQTVHSLIIMMMNTMMRSTMMINIMKMHIMMMSIMVMSSMMMKNMRGRNMKLQGKSRRWKVFSPICMPTE
jgi:hypothetical protein